MEDAATTVSIALQRGQPDEIAKEDIVKLHDRYTKVFCATIALQSNRQGVPCLRA
jgi:hypothetical protein